MAIFYVLLTVSAILFASQFLLTKQFQRFNGDSLYSTLKLTLFAYVTIAVFFFVKANIGASQLKFGFSIFTLLMTLGIAVVSMTCMYLGVKVLGIGNMSVYSVFMMVGSMVLPSLVGLVFYGEELTWLKGVAILLMLVSIVFMTNKDDTKANKKALFFYVGVFILNGLVGVLFTIHQNQPLLSAYYEVIDGVAVSNSDVFMSWYGISTSVLAGIILIVYKIVNK